MLGHQLRRALPLFALAILAAGLALCAAATASPANRESPGNWCGGTLWRMLTLSDDGRRGVNEQLW